MIFQWGLSSYRSHDILIWVMIIFAAVMAFFLLMEFFNTRKSYHLLWGSALILTFIAFHQVANTGSYWWLIDELGAGFMILIPGMIAAGLLLAVFENKQLIGKIYLLIIIIEAIFTTIIGLNYINSALDIEMGFRIVMIAQSSIISLGIMLVLPIYTTVISKETTKKSFLITIAAALLIIWGIAFVIAMTFGEAFVVAWQVINFPILLDNLALYWIFGFFPYFFMFSMALVILGMLYEPKWKFTIPGVDLEDEGRKDKLTIPELKPTIGHIVGIAGGVVLLAGAVLANFIMGSQTVIMAVTLGLLIVGGLLGAIIGFAVLLGWKPEIWDRQITNYIRIGLGALTLIFAIILLLSPVSIVAVFLPPSSGAIFTVLSPILALLGAILIIVGGILSEFLFKE